MAPTTKAAAKAAKAPAKAATKKAATKASEAKKPPAKAAAKKAAPAKAASSAKAPAAKADAKAPAKKAPAKAAAKVAEAPRRRTIPALAKRSAADENRKPPAKRKGPLDKFLLGQLETLKEERATYTRQAASLKAEADLLVFEREPGDVQFDEESGEGDTIAVERERDLALSAQASAAVEEIDRAIAKIEDGTYGVCEQCGEPIGKLRLMAFPRATLCMDCKRREERR